MDPLNIMLNLEQVIPYYQPIISADTQLVIGYEVSAYYKSDEEDIQDLDWFFNDDTIPDEFKIELTTIIHQKAIEDFIKTNHSLIFLKYNAKLLYKDNGETFLRLLETYAEKGLDYKKIVLELKETDIMEEMDSLRHLLKYLKTFGIQIALDDVGQRNGNLERLVSLKPNIVKLDVQFLKENELPHLYDDVHLSLSKLSRKIGATLLFKGVSTYNQLNYAWRNGGRYYQGSYLKPANPEFAREDCCKKQIQRDFQLFVSFERKKLKAQVELTNWINNQFNTILQNINSEEAYDQIITKVGHACHEFVFRVYMTNEEGVQLSSNAEKDHNDKWTLHEEGKEKNWSWRPYFFENIARMNVEKRGILSDLYTDITRHEQIRTFSFPLTKTSYIFLDIPYDYLFEQEGLL
ncbi:EAL domain-containing protein [Oceanobacillus bengalensis]|uniref:EAL domain-containing protein n=1 Tax=Oceanobacillus bengalensis TaxID=1435466 RepID=A0A494YU71_9BACI|nr:EAL-associated domain-containing protein [Oceanobacillus bengalensis]RKQ13567.1 EAL domain-containing protein [Oceanobacillus bengalensis]